MSFEDWEKIYSAIREPTKHYERVLSQANEEDAEQLIANLDSSLYPNLPGELLLNFRRNLTLVKLIVTYHREALLQYQHLELTFRMAIQDNNEDVVIWLLQNTNVNPVSGFIVTISADNLQMYDVILQHGKLGMINRIYYTLRRWLS